MARYGDLDSQYCDDAGNPLVNGKIYFYETGTTTPKTTYADVNYTIPNTNPVILTAAGRQPNIFFEGVAKAILTKSDDAQLLVRDPVGDTASTFGNAWIASKDYNANDVVQGSDGNFYVSLTNGNVNNNPITSSGYWTFLYSVEWSAGTTYKLGSVVTYETIVYQSLQNSNLNKNPVTETSYWVPIQLVWNSSTTYAINANVVGTDGILYTSLQNGNIGHTPASSPTWWVGTSAAAAASATAAASSATSSSTSATNAATSATSASSSASSASTSATNAAASATNASTQASNASTSASSAATSATNALSYLNTFKGQYYGPLSSDPTVDPLGAAMTAGDLYWNTTASQMKVYTGSAWITAYVPVSGYAQSGANSDITSLSGLTTPLSVGQGGTGSTTLTANNVVLGNGTSAVQFVAPGTSGNVLTSNGTTWTSSTPTAGGITNIVTATTSTTLTSTKTLLQITPTSYGVTVTLPNATTMTAGGPAHVIDNRSAYSVRVVNNSNTLLGFVPAKSTVPVFLDSAATSAGVWSFTGLARLGISAQLATTVITAWAFRGIIAVDMDGDIEIVYGNRSSDGYFTAVAYKNSTNTFGTPVVIRSASVTNYNIALKHSATQLLAVSCNATTALEAVIVTLNASTLALTVNTAATATLAGNITAFITGCALVALPSLSNSFVLTYSRATSVQAIRAISVSGTTVTIGAETALDGTDSGAIVATADKVIAASINSTSGNLYTKPYTISGSTITAGTGTTTAGTALTMAVGRFFALGTRWCVLYLDNSQIYGGIVSLSGTTTSISTAAVLTGSSSLQDAIVINSSKVLVGGSSTQNIVTDSSGTISVGTAISTVSSAFRGLFVVSDVAYVSEAAATTPSYRAIDCSGSSPVVAKTLSLSFNAVFQASPTDIALNKNSNTFFTSNYALPIGLLNATTPFLAEITAGAVNAVQPPFTILTSFGRGRNDAERWAVSNSDLLSKMECAQ